MSALNSTEPRNAHRKPIAACISSIFALAAPTAYATTFVTNCNDERDNEGDTSSTEVQAVPRKLQT